MLTSVLGFDNKSLTISTKLSSTAKYNAFSSKQNLLEYHLKFKNERNKKIIFMLKLN